VNLDSLGDAGALAVWLTVVVGETDVSAQGEFEFELEPGDVVIT